MPLMGCDLSVEYQPTLDMDAAVAAGVRFVAVKVSDGTKGYDRYEAALDIVSDARKRRLVALGYHYVRPGIDAHTQADMFARQIRRAGVAGVLDVEEGDASMVDLAREIVWQTVSTYGQRVALTYLPRWWWQQVGSPSLAGLPLLWASHYVSSGGTETTGSPASIAAGVDPTWWDSYGGKSVRMLQFTSKATIDGKLMDADLFSGTRAELESLTAWPIR
jgi:lysozyme